MLQTKLKAFQTEFGGTIYGDNINNAVINTLSIDSRNIAAKDTFVAIKGNNSHGHLYCKAAENKQAAIIVTEKFIDGIGIPQLVVKDSVVALQQLGKFKRTNSNATVVAITGSCGKTTVKEMLRAILEQHLTSEQLVITEANLNNELGVPLTLSKISAKTKIAIVEMGARFKGDIEFLCSLAKPKIRLINNISAAHIAGFNSIEQVAKTKAEIYNNVKADDVCVINLDNSYCQSQIHNINKANTFSYSRQNTEANLYCSNAEQTKTSQILTLQHNNSTGSSFKINLNVKGEHQIANALAACCVAINLGIGYKKIATGLANFKSSMRRLEHKQLANDNLLIDDSYNANPASTVSAINYLQQIATNKSLLVLGAMTDLGAETSREQHQYIYAKCRHLNCLFYGKQWQQVPTLNANKLFMDHSKLITAINKQLASGSNTILIKGSRSMQMDFVADQLQTTEV